MIFLLASAIYRLPRRDFSFGRHNPSITVLLFSFGQRDTPSAAPRFSFASARSVDCCAAKKILLARVTRRLPRRKFFSWPA
jgi:hypothetical protein